MMLTLVSRGTLWFTKWVGNNWLVNCTPVHSTNLNRVADSTIFNVIGEENH